MEEKLYNLDIIFAIVYIIRYTQIMYFRNWAAERLKTTIMY